MGTGQGVIADAVGHRQQPFGTLDLTNRSAALPRQRRHQRTDAR
jgi:hypothetical protein